MLKKNENKSKLLSGALILSLSTLAIKLLGVVYKIPLANYLSDEGMGYFNSAYTVFSFFYLICTAGVPKAVMILESKDRPLRESRERIRISLCFFGALGFLFSLGLIVFSSPLSRFVGNSNSRFTLVSIAPSILFVSMGGVLRGKLSADMHLGQVAISQLIEAVGRLALGLLFAEVGVRKFLPLPIISAMTILGVTLGSALGFLYLYVCYKTNKTEENFEQNAITDFSHCKKQITDILKISLPITLGAAVMSGTNIIDLILIMRNLTDVGYTETEASALYGNYTTLAVPMFNLAISLLTPLSIAFVPTFSREGTSENDSELKKSLKAALELIALFSVPMSLGMYTYAEEILGLLFKDANIALGAQLLKALTPGVYVMGMLIMVNSFLESTKEAAVPVFSMLIGSVFKIICTLLLIKNPSFGIISAPIGTVICYTVALFIGVCWLFVKKRTLVPLVETTIIPTACSLLALILTRPLYIRARASLGISPALFITIGAVASVYILLCGPIYCLVTKKYFKMAKYTKTA